jgi:hypothetical protein
MDKWIATVLVIVALLVGGFGGIATFPKTIEVPGPERVVVTEKVVTVEKPVEVVTERIVEVESGARIEELLARINELETERDEVSPAPLGTLIDKLFLGDGVYAKIDDGDLAKMFDGRIEFRDHRYDAHEELVLVNGKAYIMYSLIDDERLAETPALGFIDKGALEYRYVLDDPVEMADVTDAKPLAVEFLGSELEIVELSATRATFRFGEKHYLSEGESVTYGGKRVSLEFIGENGKASVCVEDACKVVAEYDSETIGGVSVRVEDILVNSRSGSATLVVGEDTLVEQKDGDYWMDADRSEWRLNIESASGELKALVLTYSERRDDVRDTYAPLSVGDKLCTPNEYLCVEFAELEEAEYVQYDFAFDGYSETLADDTDVDKDECILISADGDTIEAASEDVSEVHVCSDGSAYYADSSGDAFATTVANVRLTNDDAEYDIGIAGGKLTLTGDYDPVISLDTRWALEQLGDEESENEDGDIVVGTQSIGARDYDVLLPSGAVIPTPSSLSDSDEFTISVPSDRVEAVLRVV